MNQIKFPKGIITIEIDGTKHLAEFMGRQSGFECVICSKGENCFTFNLFNDAESYKNGQYETWGFGRNHIHHVKLI